MCSICSPSSPEPPNPIATAAAQTGTNVSTGVANAFLNNMNQVTPQGTLTYTTDPANNYSWHDPTTGQTYSIPRFTATQALANQTQRDTQTQQEQSKLQLATLANEQGARLQTALGRPFDPSQGPAVGDPSGLTGVGQAGTTFGDAGQQQFSLGPYGQQAGTYAGAGNQLMDFANAGNQATDYGGTGGYQLNAGPYAQQQMGFGGFGNITGSLGNYGQQQFALGPYGQQQAGFGDAGAQQGQFGATPGSIFGFGGAGDITRSYGPQDNFSADRQRVEQSLFDRLNPQLDRQRQQIQQQLSDQGIRYGSPAYTAAMDDFNVGQ
jgi:hypothetical protein